MAKCRPSSRTGMVPARRWPRERVTLPRASHCRIEMLHVELHLAVTAQVHSLLQKDLLEGFLAVAGHGVHVRQGTRLDSETPLLRHERGADTLPLGLGGDADRA